MCVVAMKNPEIDFPKDIARYSKDAIRAVCED